jgi:hypothetical protein
MTRLQHSKNHLWKFVQLGMAIIGRLWWHMKAYGIVLSIMLLTFASLGFLYIHRFGNRSLGEQEWNTLKSK